MDDFLKKLKKVVRVVLYGPAISQSDAGKPVRIIYHMIYYYIGCSKKNYRCLVNNKTNPFCLISKISFILSKT